MFSFSYFSFGVANVWRTYDDRSSSLEKLLLRKLGKKSTFMMIIRNITFKIIIIHNDFPSVIFLNPSI